MIRNLKDQTLKNAEQDWLKTNLARFSRMLQGERDLTTVSRLIMSELAPLVNAQYGVFYVTNRDDERDLSGACRLLWRREQVDDPPAPRPARRPDRPERCRQARHHARQRAVGFPARSPRGWAMPRPPTSSSCRRCSRTRSRRSSSSPRSASSATRTSPSSTS